MPLWLLLSSPDYGMEGGGSPEGCSHNDATLHRIIWPGGGVGQGEGVSHFSSTVVHQLQAL